MCGPGAHGSYRLALGGFKPVGGDHRVVIRPAGVTLDAGRATSVTYSGAHTVKPATFFQGIGSEIPVGHDDKGLSQTDEDGGDLGK